MNSPLPESNSNGRIDRQFGWVVFFIAMVIALFFGGAIRTLFSPKQVALFIRQELAKRDTKFDLEFRSAQLSLARGIFPRVGLQLGGVQVRAKDPCVTGAQLRVESLFFPVDVLALLEDRLRFHRIEVGASELRLGHRICTSSSLASHDSAKETEEIANSKEGPRDLMSARAPVDSMIEDFKKFVNTRWKQELINTRQWLSGLDVESLTIQGRGEKSLVLKQLSLSMNTHGEPVEVSLVAVPSPDLIFHQPLTSIGLQLAVDEEILRLKGSSKYKEGSLLLEGNLILASQQYHIKSQLKHLPLSEVLKGLSEEKLPLRFQGFQSVWLSCEQSANGELANWRTMNVHVKDCVLNGDSGVVKISQASFHPFLKDKEVESFIIKLSNFSLLSLLEVFDTELGRGVFHQFGHLTGEILVENLKKFNFSGQLNNFSFIFSRQQRRAYQVVKSADLKILFSKERLSGQLENADLEAGQFQGTISLNLDNRLNEGVFQINVNNLDFQPKVDKLMASAEVAPLEVYGQGEISRGQIVSWKGSLGVPEVSAENWTLKLLKLNMQYTQERLKGALKMASIELNSQTSMHRLLNPLYLEYKKTSDPIYLKRMATRILISKDKVMWSRARAEDPHSNTVFASEGAWNSSGQLQGSVNVDLKDLKLLQWELSGDVESPMLSPSAKMLRKLAQKKPDMQTPESVEFRGNQQFLPNTFSKHEIEILKNFGKKMIQSTQQLVPQRSHRLQNEERVFDESTAKEDSQ